MHIPGMSKYMVRDPSGLLCPVVSWVSTGIVHSFVIRCYCIVLRMRSKHGCGGFFWLLLEKFPTQFECPRRYGLRNVPGMTWRWHSVIGIPSVFFSISVPSVSGVMGFAAFWHDFQAIW